MDSTSGGEDTIRAFSASLLKLLAAERDEELSRYGELTSTKSKKALERGGQCLRNLVAPKVSTGLGGLLNVSLEHSLHSKSHPHPLAAHTFRHGDVVLLQPSNSGLRDPGLEAVVSRSKECGLNLSMRRLEDSKAEVYHELYGALVGSSDRNLWSIVRQPNDITYKRCKLAMEHVGSMVAYASQFEAERRRRMLHLRDVIYGLSPPRFSAEVAFVPFNEGLNESQLEAVRFALASEDVALIHGPPGTGKTTTVVEVIMQAAARGMKVLATAPSNIAVDNIAERLLARWKQLANVTRDAARGGLVRVGHPARVLPSVSRRTLDVLLKESDGGGIVSDVKREIRSIASKLQSCKGAERRSLWGELRELRKELKVRERKSVTDLLATCNVVLATNTGCDHFAIRNVNTFDVVVIDEAAQATEPAAWIPLLKGARVVLAGDHKQLPPTILSVDAAKGGLDRTLFDRLVHRYGESVCRMLSTQYRMHEDIMSFSNKELYGGKLIADPSVRCHLVSDLGAVAERLKCLGDDRLQELVSLPTLFIDSAFCELDESDELQIDFVEGSKANPGEAGIVAQHVALLLASGLASSDVAVITPYNAQVALLKDILRSDEMAAMVRRVSGSTGSTSVVKAQLLDLEVGSVDGFQGREKEAVVISLVRSNKTKSVGFLADERRLNVALTRARRHLCVIGDSNTVSSNPFLRRMVDHLRDHGGYESAELYTNETRAGSVCSSSPPVGPDKERKIEAGAPMVVPSMRVAAKADTKLDRLGPHIGKAPPVSRPGSRSPLPDTVSTGNADTGGLRALGAQKRAISHDEKAMERLNTALRVWEGGDDRESPLEFPSSLSAYERRLVHEVAETRGLKHWSEGVGTSRRVLIDHAREDTSNEEDPKGDSAGPALASTEAASSPKSSNIPSNRDGKKPTGKGGKNRAGRGGKNPTDRGGKKQTDARARERKGASNQRGLIENKGREGHRLGSSSGSRAKDANLCVFGKCARSTRLMGSTCKFCNRKFCFSHGVPESHGCGAAAKTSARKEFEDNWKNKDGVSRVDLKARLKEKKGEKTSQRTRTLKGDEKGSGGNARGRGRRRRGKRR